MFRSFILTLLAATTLLAPATVAPKYANKAEAAVKLYYCDVSITYNGKTSRGYLGGYRSDSDARYYYSLWARGIGARYKPRLNRVFASY